MVIRLGFKKKKSRRRHKRTGSGLDTHKNTHGHLSHIIFTYKLLKNMQH